jgi:peptidyl-prolyl cis-trans isomerase C
MMSSSTGCGGGTCGCASATAAPAPAATINGIALQAAGESLDEGSLRERAWAELLRQEAVRQGLLSQCHDAIAPALTPQDQQAIEAMLQAEIVVPVPSDDECRRFYESRKSHFVQGAQVHARHILFAVTQGVDVARLAARAEQALLELGRPDVAPERFGELARQLSNCPTGASGGDLGWTGPHEFADELANELFHQSAPGDGLGLRPRLVHSRYGFHIIEVLERQPGHEPGFEQVKQRIAGQLAQQARARALHQYMQLLAGRAEVEGVALQEAGSPLVQ